MCKTLLTCSSRCEQDTTEFPVCSLPTHMLGKEALICLHGDPDSWTLSVLSAAVQSFIVCNAIPKCGLGMWPKHMA